MLFLWFCLPFLQPCVVSWPSSHVVLWLVWLHFLHWSWFLLEQLCSQTPAGRFIASGKQPDLQGSSPGGAGHFLSTFPMGTLSREVYFAPHVATGFSSTWRGQKPVRSSRRMVPRCCEVYKVNVSCLSAGIQDSAGEQRAIRQPAFHRSQAAPGRRVLCLGWVPACQLEGWQLCFS